MLDLINTDTRHLNLEQCKKTDMRNLQNLIYYDLEQRSSHHIVIIVRVIVIVTMQGLHTETPVLPEGWPGWVTLAGAVLT